MTPTGHETSNLRFWLALAATATGRWPTIHYYHSGLMRPTIRPLLLFDGTRVGLLSRRPRTTSISAQVDRQHRALGLLLGVCVREGGCVRVSDKVNHLARH